LIYSAQSAIHTILLIGCIKFNDGAESIKTLRQGRKEVTPMPGNTVKIIVNDELCASRIIVPAGHLAVRNKYAFNLLLTYFNKSYHGLARIRKAMNITGYFGGLRIENCSKLLRIFFHFLKKRIILLADPILP